jgi:5'-nucleotidase
MKDFSEHITERSSRGIIYCDLDGVLTDLIGAIRDLYDIPDLDEKNFDHYISKIKDDLNKSHPNLFAHLPWMRDGKKLWSHLSNQHNVVILTSTPKVWLPRGATDKPKWVSNRLGPNITTIVVKGSHEKKKYAVTNGVPNILIDDYDKNISEWISAGGMGIHHKNADETISKLNKILRP